MVKYIHKNLDQGTRRMSTYRPSFVITERNGVLSFQAAKVKRRNVYIVLAAREK